MIIFFNICFILLFSSIANSESIHFKSCNETHEPSLKRSLIDESQRQNICPDDRMVPNKLNLGDIDDLLKTPDSLVNTSQKSNKKAIFFKRVQNKVRFLTKLNLKELELQKKCFTNKKSDPFCEKVKSNITSRIAANWDNMSMGLLLGFNENSIVRYSFGAEAPDLVIRSKKINHLFGGSIDINSATISAAQNIFEQNRKQFGNHISSGLRDHIHEDYKTQYTEALVKAPIMAYLSTKNPDDKQIADAIDRMIENNKNLEKEPLDASTLAGFLPVIDSILNESPEYCHLADNWIEEKIKKDKIKSYGRLALAGTTAAGCALTAWTGVGMSLCFVTGALLTGQSLYSAGQEKDLENSRTFTRALDSRLINDFDKLSDVEQNYALERALAPLAVLGVGTLAKTIAPSARAASWATNAKNSIAIYTRSISKNIKPFKGGLRKQTIKTSEAKKYFDSIENFNDLPQVKIENLSEITPFKKDAFPAENFFYTAKIGEKEVFIKTMDDVVEKGSEEFFLREVKNYAMMDKLGLGAPFHGVVKVNGKYGYVVDKIEGTLVKQPSGKINSTNPHPELASKGLRVYQSVIDDMETSVDRLYDAGIRDYTDVQFMISPDGKTATLIDPAYFIFKSRGNPHTSGENPQIFQSIIRSLQPLVVR